MKANPPAIPIEIRHAVLTKPASLFTPYALILVSGGFRKTSISASDEAVSRAVVRNVNIPGYLLVLVNDYVGSRTDIKKCSQA